MNEFQCPNCGGYKTSSTVTNYVKEDMPVPAATRVWMGLIGAGLISVYFFSPNSGGLFMAGAGALLFLLPALFVTTTYKKVPEAYHLACSLCGYQWNWRRGQPVPKVIPNPELIARGMQEELRRKQQEDAAALYHLTHKK